MITYTFPELHPTTSGPWTNEPDKAQWIDEATGLDCLMVRSPVGALCGYVGVPPNHPWHGVDYEQCLLKPQCEDWCSHTPGSLTEVHGSLTFANLCREGAEDGRGVCHIPQDGRPANVWWFGFDCAHLGDFTPYRSGHDPYPGDGHETYKTLEYVQSECANLAAQLAMHKATT